MKKLLLITLGFTALMANAQIYSEDFNAGIPGTFTLTDVDGLTPSASLSTYTNAFIGTTHTGANGVTKSCAASTSWFSPAGQANDWMSTAAIALPITTNSIQLEWNSLAVDANFPDGLQVYISTTGGTPADFTSAAIYSSAAEPAAWTNHTYDVSAFAGQSIYVGFRNNSTDQYILAVDDIIIKEILANDAEMTSLNIVPYAAAGNISIAGVITNQGSNPITAMDITWNDGTGSQTDNLTGLNIAFGGTYNFTHTTPLNVVAGTSYTLAVSVTLIGDLDLLNNSLIGNSVGLTQIPTKTVVGELKTGTWNGWEPRGLVSLAGMESTSNFIGIAVHNSDPMSIASYDGAIGTYIPGGFPGGGVDRVIVGDPSTYNTMHTTRASTIVPCDVKNVQLTVVGAQISVSADSEWYGNITGDYRLSCVIIEDNVMDVGVGWSQTNYYSAGANGSMIDPVSGFDWSTATNPVNAATFGGYDHVARSLSNDDIMGNVNSLPMNPTTGVHSYSFANVPTSVVGNINNAYAVVMVINATTGEILNAASSASPNQPIANFSGTPLVTCAGSTVTFTNTSTGITSSATYAWNFGTGATPATANTVGPHTVTYGSAGLKTVSLITTDGLADTLTKTAYINVSSNSTGTDTQVSCDSYLWIDGNTYTVSNTTATHTLTNAAGCDSVVTLNLSINNSTGSDLQTACNSYLWIDGNTYTANNTTATHTIANGNANGCDSVVTLNLTINNSVGTDIQTACNTYTWIDGNAYTANNTTATHPLTNANGCDSIVTLNLIINNATAGTDVQTACNTYLWIDGNTYTSNNSIATFTIANANGCDSVVTLDLTINNTSAGTDTQTACDTYAWIDGNTYTSNNTTAIHTLTNANGCDSTVTLNLTINNATAGIDAQTACNSYLWIDGNTYTTSNTTATHTLTNAAGCDSVVTLNLTINNSTGTDVQTACNSYLWINGNTYTANNTTATHTIANGNANGCDSVVTLNLTINNSTGTDIQTACNTYTWIDGNAYTANNTTATHTLTNAAGCDSIVTLNLIINNATAGTDVQTACNTYLWIDGNTYTSNNSIATFTIANANGCDSVVTLDLTINNTSAGTDTQTACNTYTWIDGNAYTTSNTTATHTLTNANGCDSVVTLNLTIINSSTGTDTQTACNTYTWIDGNTYTTSNTTATHTLTNAAGCDSIVTLNLTLNTVSNLTVTNSGNLLTANNTNLGVTYQWLDCNNSYAIIVSETAQVYTVTVNGDYAVEITENSCVDTSACENVSTIGIEKSSFDNSFTIYPNPTTGSVNIDLEATKSNINLRLTNALGQVLITKNYLSTNHINFNLEAPKGIYFLRLESDGEVITKKILKE